jgi:DNA-binding protein HU-beta
MNKAELIDDLAGHEGLSKAQTERILDTLSRSITEALRAGHKVILPGLGHLEPVTRKGRKGRNPRTGDKIDIQAKRSVKFQPGKALKDTLTA